MHHIQENLKMKIIFLPSWVATKDSAAPEGGSEISIEKLETQLNTLKTMFAEKQKLVSDLEAYGPEGGFFFKINIDRQRPFHSYYK